MKVDELSSQIKLARSRLLRMHYESGVGHIGGNLSCLEILMSFYHNIITKEDHFILSKGHSAGALYVALWSINKLSEDDLKTFHKDGTKLSGHPPVEGIEEIPFATGSLGHGFSLACGIALGMKIKGRRGKVFCLTSDGEWNEGSSWEALIFASHHELSNLTLIVDTNGLQGFGTTRDVANLGRLADKFRSFNCLVVEIDGHSIDEIMASASITSNKLKVFIAHTVKGKGVSFMENKIEWHYWPMTKEQYEIALAEVESR